MEDAYVFVLPVVTSAAFSINPVDVNETTLISVGVEEQSKTLYAEARKCGEYLTGEV